MTGKPNPSKIQFLASSKFVEFYNRVFQGVHDRLYIHPKLEKLKEYLVDHFRRNNAAGRDTRVIVFAEYRSSVQEILNYLRGSELIRATAFVGQQKKSTDIVKMNNEGDIVNDGSMLYDVHGANPSPKKTISSFFVSSSTQHPNPPLPASVMSMVQVNGQSQKQQQQILKDFKAGKYNVLVATCIAEEGLDIGEVDLLICYEGISSPTRLLQRKGRTGRKRTGRVVILLTEGSEYQKHKRSIQKYNSVSELLKSRVSSLHLCPDTATLFLSSFHPTCVQESLDIHEYHYSQIGGHTPKKRRLNKEEAFLKSERGARISALVSELDDSAVLMNEGWSAPSAVWKCGHSDETAAVCAITRMIADGSLARTYPLSATQRWVKDESQVSQKWNEERFLSTDSEEEPINLIRGILGGEEEESELEDDFGSQRETCVWRERVRNRHEPAVSVLDMVERQANDLLKKLNAPSRDEEAQVISIVSDDDSEDMPIQGAASVQPVVDVPSPEREESVVAQKQEESAVQKRDDPATIQERAESATVQKHEEASPNPVQMPSPQSTLSDSSEDELLPIISAPKDPVTITPLALPTSPVKPPPIHNTPTPSEPPPKPEPLSKPKPEPLSKPNPEPLPKPNPEAAAKDVALESSSSEEEEPISLLSTSVKRPHFTPSDTSKSSSSSLLIPLVASSLSVVDTSISNVRSTLGDPHPLPAAVKPPPLSKEVIDELFPRESEVLPKRPRTASSPPTALCCPLCFRMCASAELLRDHLNYECDCLPPMVSDEEKEAISKLLDIPDAPSVHAPAPASAPVADSSFGMNSEEIDSLLRMEVEAAPATCAICRDASEDADNPLLRCAHCGVRVHPGCYGLSTVPAGRWQCDVRGCGGD